MEKSTCSSESGWKLARSGRVTLALTSVAGLTLIDMVKALEKGVSIERVRLLAKSGGRSGDWRRG